MADTRDAEPRTERPVDDSKPVENPPEVSEEQRHNANVTPGWGQSNQGEDDNWGNQGNHGNEGYFQGVQDKTTNLAGEAAAARNLKPGK